MCGLCVAVNAGAGGWLNSVGGVRLYPVFDQFSTQQDIMHCLWAERAPESVHGRPPPPVTFANASIWFWHRRWRRRRRRLCSAAGNIQQSAVRWQRQRGGGAALRVTENRWQTTRFKRCWWVIIPHHCVYLSEFECSAGGWMDGWWWLTLSDTCLGRRRLWVGCLPARISLRQPMIGGVFWMQMSCFETLLFTRSLKCN